MDENITNITLEALEKFRSEVQVQNDADKLQYEKSGQKLLDINKAITQTRNAISPAAYIPEPIQPEKKQEALNIEGKPLTFNLFSENEYSPQNQSKISLVAGSEQILTKSDRPLHISELLVELNKLGRFVTAAILNGTIRKDPKQRFINLGKNVWDLRRRHPQTEQLKNEQEDKQELVSE